MEIQKIFSELGGEEKLYSISLDETEMILFGEFQKEFNSKAQKALKRKWEASEGKEYLKPGDSADMKRHLDAKTRNIEFSNDLKKKSAELLGEKPKLRNVGQIAKKDPTTEASIRNFRRENKFWGTEDKLAEKAKLSKNGLKDKMKSELESFQRGKTTGKLHHDQEVLSSIFGHEKPKKDKLGNSSFDLGRKKGYKDASKKYNEQLAAEKAKEDARKAAEKLAAEKKAAEIAKKKASQDSIAHHQKVANALKKKKMTNIAKKSALGTAAVIGSGIVAKKIYDKNKKDKK